MLHTLAPEKIKANNFYVEPGWYIHQNPVQNGFVLIQKDLLFGNAKGYAKNNGIIKLVEC